MSTQLIPVYYDRVPRAKCPVVDSRELWHFLAMGMPHVDWMTHRIAQHELIHLHDYWPTSGLLDRIVPSGLSSAGYFLTLDVAMELCRREHSRVGEQARTYLRGRLCEFWVNNWQEKAQ